MKKRTDCEGVEFFTPNEVKDTPGYPIDLISFPNGGVAFPNARW